MRAASTPSMGPPANTRRKSDQALLEKPNGSSVKPRRKTIAGDKSAKENSATKTPKGKTPSKHRLNLGSASAYYFKNVPKGSVDASGLNTSVNASFQEGLAGSGYDGSVAAAETSFLSYASTSSNSEGSDLLNKSVLSDTTELTASNFVLAASSRQRLSEISRQDEQEVAQAMTDMMKADSVQKEPPLKPLGLSFANSENRRNTLPPGGASLQQSSQESNDSSTTALRRESWQGPSPGTFNAQNLREFAASMKSRRLSRQQQSQNNNNNNDSRLSAGSRLSNGSDFSLLLSAEKKQPIIEPKDEPKRNSSISFQLSAMPMSETKKQSRRSSTSFLLPSMPSSAASKTSKDSLDVSKGSIDDLFDGLLDNNGDTTQAMDTSMEIDVSEDNTKESTVEKPQDEAPSKEAENADTMDHAFEDASVAEKSTEADEVEKSMEAASVAAGSVASSAVKTISSSASVSPASTISSHAGASQKIAKPRSSEIGVSPRPLPEAIAFEPSADSLRADETSPFRTKPSSSTKSKLLTPTRLTGSPRRIINPDAIDSPARNTRSARKSKSPTADPIDSPARTTRSSRKSKSPTADPINSPARNTHSVRESMAAVADAIDSPARNTRSSRKSQSPEKEQVKSPARKSGSESESIQMEESAGKRKRESIEQGIQATELTQAELSIDYSAANAAHKRRKSSLSVAPTLSATPTLQSSFRKKSNKPDARRTVAFGSPEVVEYNITSPSMSMTPLPAKQVKEKYIMPDDTVEIEADMKNLFQIDASAPSTNLGAMNTSNAGSTPFFDRKSSIQEESEPTVELEGSLGQLLQSATDSDDAKSDMSVDSPATNADGVERTVELEVDLGTLLDNAYDSAGLVAKPSQAAEESHDEENLMSPDDGSPKETETSDMDEDHTVELETDMQSLLAEAAGEESYAMLQLNGSDSPSTTSARPRRSSLSSRRFSLAPTSRLSLCMDGELREDYESDAEEVESIAGTDSTKEMHTSEPPVEQEEVLDLVVKEVIQASGLQLQTEEGVSDVLTHVNETTRNVNVRVMSETMDAIFTEVCNQVESTMEPDIDPDSLLEVSEENKNRILALQRAIRTDDSSDVDQELARLAEAVRDSEQVNWLSWIVSVAETLKGPFGGMYEELEENRDRVESLSKLVEETQEILSSMANKAVRKARRKSMDRRTMTIASLEEEISQLEAQLERAEDYLQSARFEQKAIVSMADAADHHASIVDEHEKSRPVAVASERLWVTLKGLNRWKPMIVNESELSFRFIGPSPKACVRITFMLSETGPTSCKARIEPGCFPKEKSRLANQFKSVASFLEKRTQSICSAASKQLLEHPEMVGDFLRRQTWALGRLEHTASELAMLMRRYKAVLSPSKTVDGSTVMEVDFSSQTTSAKLFASFELSDRYPFALDVCLDKMEGELDIEEMEKLLIKNAKPGFGYLSRACDVIAAFLR